MLENEEIFTKEQLEKTAKNLLKKKQQREKNKSRENDDVRKPILDYINSLPSAYAVIFPSTRTKSRNPDILAVVEGVAYLIECKASEKGIKHQELSQSIELEKWNKSGAIARTVKSLQEVKDLINKKGLSNGEKTFHE